MASYRIEFAKRVRKHFQKIPKNDANRILLAIRGFGEEPRPPSSKKLKEQELYRIRIGIYRVIYEIKDEVLFVSVVKVGHRKDIYR